MVREKIILTFEKSDVKDFNTQNVGIVPNDHVVTEGSRPSVFTRLQGIEMIGQEQSPLVNEPPQVNVDISEVGAVNTQDVEMVSNDYEATNGSKPSVFTRLHGVATGKITKKNLTGRKDQLLKNFVVPKNSVMCLTELMPSVNFRAQPDTTGIPGSSTCSVEVNRIKYIGTGYTKELAKEDAAEAALISFVKQPSYTSDGSLEENKTPWDVLAHFAMYKLFNRWIDEDRARICFEPEVTQTADLENSQQPLNENDELMDCNKDRNEVLSNYLKMSSPKVSNTTTLPKKDVGTTKLPENAAEMNPSMLLNQMAPNFKMVQSQFVRKEDQRKMFKITSVLNDTTFIGEGTNMKTAKCNMAAKANKALFGVDCTYQVNQQ